MATLEEIKELRKLSGAGINAVKEALDISGGNFDEAIKYLREKGIAKAEKRKGRVVDNGIIATYVHSTNRLSVVAQIACETDFAAKSDEMQKFAKDITIHIAAVSPRYLNVESIPGDVLAEEKRNAEVGLENKPESIRENIINGRLGKFYEDNVLMKQKFFSDESKTVEDYLNEMLAKIGEKIEISYFYIFSIGEEVQFSTVKE